MIMIRTPLRISFAGGGSDLRVFYKKRYGAVVSTAINKYMNVMIHPYFHNKIRIKYSKTEDIDSVDEIRHPIVREGLKLLDVDKGVEIASIADVPARTGLGSSSSFTVSLLHALSAYKRRLVTKKWLAEKACEIEIGILKEPIGKQDQYAVSFGGLNYMRFNPDETVWIEPLTLNCQIKKQLENNLLMFYVGNERRAKQILNEQRKRMREEDKYKTVFEMVNIAEEMKQFLFQGVLEEFGKLLHKAWLLKRGLTDKISNLQLDEIYSKALKAGAVGGKILGAGGGGFFLFYCEPKYQDKLRKALNLRELEFKFENEGTKIVYFDGQ